MSSSNASTVLSRAPGSSVLDMIGRTPLVRLHQFERETPGEKPGKHEIYMEGRP